MDATYSTMYTTTMLYVLSNRFCYLNHFPTNKFHTCYLIDNIVLFLLQIQLYCH